MSEYSETAESRRLVKEVHRLLNDAVDSERIPGVTASYAIGYVLPMLNTGQLRALEAALWRQIARNGR